MVADDEEVDADAAAVPPSSFFALAIDAKPRAQLAERADSWFFVLEFEAVDVKSAVDHESKSTSQKNIPSPWLFYSLILLSLPAPRA